MAGMMRKARASPSVPARILFIAQARVVSACYRATLRAIAPIPHPPRVCGARQHYGRLSPSSTIGGSPFNIEDCSGGPSRASYTKGGPCRSIAEYLPESRRRRTDIRGYRPVKFTAASPKNQNCRGRHLNRKVKDSIQPPSLDRRTVNIRSYPRRTWNAMNRSSFSPLVAPH